MSKSFKMLVLLGALNEDKFPGEIDIGTLAKAVRRIAARSPDLRAEFGDAFEDEQAFRRLLERNPIAAWIGGQGTGGRSYFVYENQKFATTFAVADAQREAIQDLTRELAEWRLADYQARATAGTTDGQFVCRVFHSSGKPILKLPDRETMQGLPSGWTTVRTKDGPYEANFAKIAVNQLREPDGSSNVLAQVLRKWFGPDAGLPGTRFEVAFSPEARAISWSRETRRQERRQKLNYGRPTPGNRFLDYSACRSRQCNGIRDSFRRRSMCSCWLLWTNRAWRPRISIAITSSRQRSLSGKVRIGRPRSQNMGN
jgi:hypothetical protein